MRRFLCRISTAGLLLGGFALAQSNLDRAVTAAREKRYTDAQRLLQDAPEPSGQVPRIAFHRLKAAVASGVGRNSDAAGEMREALQLSPGDAGLQLGAAMAELQAGELDAALHHAQQGGDSPMAKGILDQAYSAVAVDLIAHRKFRTAIDLLQAAIPVLPESARIRTILGIAQYSNADTEDAVSTLTAAINLDPKEEAAYLALAQIVLRYAAAPGEAVRTQLCRWNKTVCSALDLRVARERDDAVLLERAMDDLSRAAQSDPMARCELARAWEWRDHLPEARTEMEACVQFDPSPQNHYRLGLIYRRMGLATLATQQMEIRNRLLKNDSEEAVSGLNSLRALPQGAPLRLR